MFTHLHGHSQYSLLEAIGSTKAILAKLKDLGFTHVPIMDYNGMYNVINHYEICKKEWMTPIIGVDLCIQVTMQGKSAMRSRFVTLIAKNYDGYMSLMDIVSRAQTTTNNGIACLWLTYFPETNGNIIVLLNGYESPIGDMIQAWRTHEDIVQNIAWYTEVFGEGNVILEVIPQDPKDNAELAKANKVLWALHEMTNLPIICSSDFHYIQEWDKEAFDIARCIKDGKRVFDEDRRKTQWAFHIMSEDEIREQCSKNGFSESQTQLMIDTTSSVAEPIHVEIPLHKILFPVYESPQYIKELYEEFQKSE